MPLAEIRIAELILRRLAKEINPGECRELTEGWANQSDRNQLKLKELISLGKLRDKLRDFYNNVPGHPEAHDPSSALHDSIDSGPYFPHFVKK